VITLGDTKQSTPSLPKTLNPEWMVSFDLPILGPRCLLLEAVCWDKDRFGKDYMGEFDVPIEDIFANGQATQEVGLAISFSEVKLTTAAQMVYPEVEEKGCKEKEGRPGFRGDTNAILCC
jgi:hypothetical protein